MRSDERPYWHANRCRACGDTFAQHLAGAQNNTACPCCRREEPWEVEYDAPPPVREDDCPPMDTMGERPETAE